MTLTLAEKDSYIDKMRALNEESKNKNAELADTIQKKLNIIRQDSEEIETLRGVKSTLEKQLKDLKATTDAQNALIKTGQASSDDLKAKISE